MAKRRKPLVLMILDGWGYRAETDHNAIALARTPCWDRLWAHDPHALLDTSGEAVGLPEGQMGNSEVGHMNIGAGRIVYQDFTRITQAIRDGSFRRNQALLHGIDAAAAGNRAVHIMGLLSPGGVHSHEDHFIEAVLLAAERDPAHICIHLFLDGRDTPPQSAEASILKMQNLVEGTPAASIETVSGRYYAMDRDKRWDRVEKAFNAITSGRAPFYSDSALEALQLAYARCESDEFVQPTAIGTPRGVRDGDSILFINFRADRARQLSSALLVDDFEGFKRRKPALSAFVSMTEYQEGLPALVAFPTQSLARLFPEVVAEHGLAQLRIAETEKYAHVTYFFNGGNENPFPGEERILIPSPRVPTYDLMPQMSAPELGDRLADVIRSGRFDVIVCNVANSDMVGHSGKLDAAIKAVEAVDGCLAKAVSAVDDTGGELLITSDHGNVEQMIDSQTGQAHTAHTTNPVPLVFHGRPARLSPNGLLRDIAPTMLSLLGLPVPSEMTGKVLVQAD